MKYIAVIEQTYEYPQRMKYMSESDSFIEKDCPSLSYTRGVQQPYGWIKESGTPPNDHLDVIIMTDNHYKLGDEVPIKIIGVFCRNDGDHKLVAVLEDRDINDFSELEDSEKEDMHRLYRYEDVGEGWFGRSVAEGLIRRFNGFVAEDKNIIMVQHTQSEHHINQMIGAWGDWELTEEGKEQARNIGEWLVERIDSSLFTMYVSDLKRAKQTAYEINRSLTIEPIIDKTIREVNAGQGNGKPVQWYRQHERPRLCTYNPDYKPFDDAESDRDLWNRLYPFYIKLICSEENNVIVVSHGTTLSFLQSMLFGEDFSSIAERRFNGGSGSVSSFIVKKNGKVIVKFINQHIN